MEHLNWGLPVAVDLFAAALGAAAFMVAVMADISGKKGLDSIRFAGACIAPWPAILGILFLIADLGKPLRFWEMMLRRGEGFSLQFPWIMFNPGSTMSWGTWILTLFVIISLAYLAVNVLTMPFPWGRKATMAVGIIGLPFALLVTTYTGVLISACNNPLWHSPLLPVLFVASAMVTGLAAIALVLALLKMLKIYTPEGPVMKELEKLSKWMIIVQLAVMALFILFGLGSEAMRGMVGLQFGFVFWIVVIGLGLIVPFYMVSKKGERTPAGSLLASILLLAGGFVLRYVILIAGQAV